MRPDPRVVGGTYRSGYWAEDYTVLAITYGHPIWGTQWTCRWQDGRVTTHSTEWNWRRDRVISQSTPA